MSVNVTSRPSLMLNVRMAYPGRLGTTLPTPPDGFLPEGTGFSALNRAGVFLNWNGSAWAYPDGTVYGV